MNDRQKTFLLMALLAGLVFCVSRAHAQPPGPPHTPRSSAPAPVQAGARARAVPTLAWAPPRSLESEGRERARDAASSAAGFENLGPVDLPRRSAAAGPQWRLQF
jgi:hypothetical protein